MKLLLTSIAIAALACFTSVKSQDAPTATFSANVSQIEAGQPFIIRCDISNFNLSGSESYKVHFDRIRGAIGYVEYNYTYVAPGQHISIKTAISAQVTDLAVNAADTTNQEQYYEMLIRPWESREVLLDDYWCTLENINSSVPTLRSNKWNSLNATQVSPLPVTAKFSIESLNKTGDVEEARFQCLVEGFQPDLNIHRAYTAQFKLGSNSLGSFEFQTSDFFPVRPFGPPEFRQPASLPEGVQWIGEPIFSKPSDNKLNFEISANLTSSSAKREFSCTFWWQSYEVEIESNKVTTSGAHHSTAGILILAVAFIAQFIVKMKC